MKQVCQKSFKVHGMFLFLNFFCGGGDEPTWLHMAMGNYDKTVCPDSCPVVIHLPGPYTQYHAGCRVVKNWSKPVSLNSLGRRFSCHFANFWQVKAKAQPYQCSLIRQLFDDLFRQRFFCVDHLSHSFFFFFLPSGLQSVNGITGCRIFRTGRYLQNVNVKNMNAKMPEILLQTGSSSSRIPGGNQ